MKSGMVRMLGVFALAFALTGESPGQEGRYIYYDDCDSDFPPVLPAGWVTEDINGDGTWIARPIGGGGGGGCLRIVSGPTLACNDWAFSPVISLDASLPYELTFTHRVTSDALIHSLDVYLSTSQSSPNVLQPAVVPPMLVSNREQATTTMPFAAPTTGDYSMGFHAFSDPNTLGLFIDRVIVSTPEPDLDINLQLDREFYDGTDIYDPSEDIRCHVSVRNFGAQALWLNGATGVGQENDPDAVIAFRVTGPDGLPVEAHAKYELVVPEDADFVSLEQGQSVFKNFNLNGGHYDFSTPGVYTIQAVYQNTHPATGMDVWLGKIVSNSVDLTIQINKEEQP